MNRKTIVTFATFAIVIAACAKKDETPQPTTGQPPGTMVNSGQPQPYGTQYPQPQPTGAAPAPTMTAPAPGPAPAGGGLATPNAMALPCQNDSGCGLAHCNTQYGKCAFPCQTQNDCIQGAQCNAMTGFCLPGSPPSK